MFRQRASNSLLNRLAIKAKEAARYAVRNGYSGALEKVSFTEYNDNTDYQLRLSGGNEEYHLQSYGRLNCSLIIMVTNLQYLALHLLYGLGPDADILSNGCHGHDSRHYENGNN